MLCKTYYIKGILLIVICRKFGRKYCPKNYLAAWYSRRNMGLKTYRTEYKSHLHSFTGCVASGKLLHFSEPQLSHLQNGDRSISRWRGLLQGLTTHPLWMSVAYRRCPTQVSPAAQGCPSSTIHPIRFEATPKSQLCSAVLSLEERRLPSPTLPPVCVCVRARAHREKTKYQFSAGEVSR